MIYVLRLSLKIDPGTKDEPKPVIICICRGKSEREIERTLDDGASSLRDLQRCGIGDQCGSCHNSLLAMLARSTEMAQSCPACLGESIESIAAMPAMA
jgi:bacterioferritin-associated ferredoxin